MFVDQYTAWVETASPGERAVAIEKIAEAFFDKDIDPADKDDCEQIFSLTLSDTCESVRRAMAVAVTAKEGAPAPLLWALCDDTPSVAAQIYARSTHFRPTDLTDAADNDDLIQIAVAGRHDIGGATVRALVENGNADSIIALITNGNVCLSPTLKDHLARRFSHHPQIRSLLLEFQDIAASTRLDLTLAKLDALEALAASLAPANRRIETMATDGRDRAVLSVAECAGPHDMARYVAHVQAIGALTPALLIRAICEDHAAIFEHAISALSTVPVERVQAIVDSGRTVAFQALYLRTNLNASLLPVFLAAIDIWGADGACSANRLMHMAKETDSATMRLLARIETEQRRDHWEPAERQLAIAA